jgi:ssDNA-binding Zn-finger/Zn-ribbon topoisomerase 1
MEKDYSKYKVPDCPLCNKPMVIRKSRFGHFWGCYTFPLCIGKIFITNIVKPNSYYSSRHANLMGKRK